MKGMKTRTALEPPSVVGRAQGWGTQINLKIPAMTFRLRFCRRLGIYGSFFSEERLTTGLATPSGTLGHSKICSELGKER